MDSWTLQGDSYSFLRSAPRNFSLCHRDGTPNHVEIFDIINVPNQRSAISETTCLCDIFGDDCESPSLSSSPAVAASVPPQAEVEGRAAASPLVDDQNDSSGSYHTAPGSSEGEDFEEEESKEKFHRPLLQSECSKRKVSEGEGLDSRHPDLSEDSGPNLDPNSVSPVPQDSRVSPVSEDHSTVCRERPPSGHKSPYTLSPEGRVSSLSSSSVETKRSSSSPNPRLTETEARSITPASRGRHSSLSHHTSSPSPESSNCVSSSSSPSLSTQSASEIRGAQVSPEPRSIYHQNTSPSPVLLPTSFSPDYTLSTSESRATPSSPLLSHSTELSSGSREGLVSPELKNRSYTPDTQSSSPFLDFRGRVSLPDLFSRSSTPDIEDSPQTPELISNPESTEKDKTTTPDNHDTGLPVETISTVSSPAPRYTPPSPVISSATSSELRGSSVSPEYRHTTPSPGQLSATSPAKTGTTTPSPGPSTRERYISTPSETRTPVSSPILNYSLSPSPEGTKKCSPVVCMHTASSPEIRIITSSPEVSKTAQSPDIDIKFDSPILELPSESAPSRSTSSSPHITGISYSVVQPEDRNSPPFPELSQLSSPETHRAPVSPEVRSPTPNKDITQSRSTPQASPHTTTSPFTELQPEISQVPQTSYKTPSPDLKHHTPSPQPSLHSSSSERYQNISPQHRSRDPSPVSASPEPRVHQVSREHSPLYKQPTPPLRDTPELDRSLSLVDVTEIQDSTQCCVSPSSEQERGDRSVVTEIKSRSPVVANHSPVSTSPFSSEEKVKSLLKQHSTKKKVSSKEVKFQSNSTLDSFSDKQDSDCTHFEKEEVYKNTLIEIKPPSSHLVSPVKDKKLNISPVTKGKSTSPVQILENPQPHLTTHHQPPKSSSSLKSPFTPRQIRRQLPGTTGPENRNKSKENMASHLNRRRTPSPPLTRFTPVHIIAPEKPYRPWQNRRHSPTQVVTSSPSGNLKKVVTNTETPDAAPVDNNSQAQWLRKGRQLEMEREMQLREEREVDRERQRDREMYRERKREERVPEKGEGWQGDVSYRGEQVELSFNARNRKGPVSRSAAPTSRETRQGLPTVHSYSESLLATRQLQQQQSLHRLSSQQDSRGGGPSRRLQPPVAQQKKSVSGRVATNRPCRSSSSSMGSELDEADHEVKWFTDVAFSSLSSPEVDYLDMYNSSHHSSTNVSQPSTQESPAGVNAAWLAYADFRGSAPVLDNDELAFQQPSAYYSDALDPSRRYELGSFECVDVAVEREDSRKVRRGVPKRQIQLKRKDNAEAKQDESSENSSPGVPMIDSPGLETLSRDTLLRQHSTPASMQECYPSEHSPEIDKQNETKSKLQKSASLDESCSKTKIATCLIKSVLSKKMQSTDKQTDDSTGEETSLGFGENTSQVECTVSPPKESPKPDAHILSSSLHSDFSLSSDGLAVRGEISTTDEAGLQKRFGGKSNNRPSSTNSNRSVTFSQTDSEEADSQGRNATALRSELKVPFDSKQSRAGVQADDSKTWEEREDGDSANAAAGNTGDPTAVGVISRQPRMTNRDRECESTQSHKQLQQDVKSPYMSKTQDNPLTAMEKKKASINVCLTPESENKPEDEVCFREKEEKTEASVDSKTEVEDANGNNKVKGPIHKVRDVRRLVKNTYNLSFKASSAVMPSDVSEERTEHFIEQQKETKEEKMDEVIQEEEMEIKQQVTHKERKEELREERREEQKMEIKDENVLTSSSPLLSNEKPLSRSQPMQIEYKAVCWKEDKNKMSYTTKDSENPVDKPECPLEEVVETSSESHYFSNEHTESYTASHVAVSKQRQEDLNVASETQETATQLTKMSDKEDKPAMGQTDRKPPMLGSLPRMPSKEREVSTAVVLIRDGSSKTKRSTSPAQEEIPTPHQDLASSPSPGLSTPGSTPGSSGHSVSMLLKEKGYQADIGAVVGDGQNSGGGKGLPRKHVNCLEIPLQTTMPSDGARIESHRERTFSSSSTTSGSLAVTDNTENISKTEEDGADNKPTVKDTAKQKSPSPLRNTMEQTPPPAKQKEHGDFEAVKRLDPTFPPRSPAVRRFKPQPIEVKSLTKETKKPELSTNDTVNNRPQTIEVKSIAKNSQKPAVPPKPNCKFKPADLAAAPNDTQRPPVSAATARQQGEDRPHTIVVSSPTIYRKISNDTTSNYTRKLAVSAVSSLKPPPSKTTTTVSSLSNQSVPSETEASNDRGQQQQPGASPQSSRYTQRPTTLPPAPISDSGPGLSPVVVSDSTTSQVPTPASAGVNQASQPTVIDSNSQPPYPRMTYPHEQTMSASSNSTKQPVAVSTTQAPGYTQQPYRRSLSCERSQRRDDLHFYTSDDPPSYDERESFSPLMLPDLTPRRSNRYQPTSRPPPCSCTAGCPSHPGLTPTHSHNSPHNLTPPAPPHSPGQAHPYPVGQPPLRPHQCRPDPQAVTYQPSSPKSSPIGPSQPPGLYQALHQPPPCPPHPSLMQAYPADRQMQPGQHIDPRRPPVHRSPQQQPPTMAGAPYSDPGHSHSPGLPPIDPHYLCGPQSLGPSYGSEYGGDSSSLYSESSYGQTPRRVLLDPETGKYFYIEVPVQPLRKMLFDPETGQYVEVLIPQQAMSHSGLYPPSAAPYPSIHNPNMYAPAPQYMPYAAPPPPTHAQTQPQPPRYPEASAAATMHQHGPGVSYRNPSGQGSKPDPQGHPPLDQSYLESMYYVPTGMNASPNPTPPDYYHKHPPNLPPTGGKRS